MNENKSFIQQRKSYRTINIALLLLLIVFTGFISIGYSAINASLSISGDLSYEGKPSFYKIMKSNSKGLDTNIEFRDEITDSTSGVYLRHTTNSDRYPVYYYRGNVTNNNVLFAGFCWKIVRTTEYGGVKLIYNGKSSSNTCNNTGTASQIGTSVFNKYSNERGYIRDTKYHSNFFYEEFQTKSKITFGKGITYTGASGYTLVNPISVDWNYFNGWFNSSYPQYGQHTDYHYTCTDLVGTSCSSVYFFRLDLYDAHYIKLEDGETTTDSKIKQTIDKWYSNNIKQYENMLETTGWCNDTYPVATIENYNNYNGYQLLMEGGSNIDFSCGNIDQKIGLLTADEIIINGYGKNYLSTGQSWSTATLFNSETDGENEKNVNILIVDNTSLTPAAINSSYGVRPAITIKESTKAISGTGTASNPYKIA